MPFLVEVLTAARAAGLEVDSIEAASMVRFMDGFWKTDPGRLWIAKILGAFLLHSWDRVASRTVSASSSRASMSAGDFVRQTEKAGESREKLRMAFNTPLYPMVLIANEVMQEGLDLHHQCARRGAPRPGLEPSTTGAAGRADRPLGSRTLQLRAKDPEAVLDVVYPLIHRTIDERLYRTVKMREKWLEFLLGAAPTYDEYSISDEIPPPLPEGLAEELRVNLRPDAVG